VAAVLSSRPRRIRSNPRATLRRGGDPDRRHGGDRCPVSARRLENALASRRRPKGLRGIVSPATQTEPSGNYLIPVADRSYENEPAMGRDYVRSVPFTRQPLKVPRNIESLGVK
jgi:hypothetical protein